MNSTFKIAAFNIAICSALISTLIACTGNKDGGGEGASQPMADGLNPSAFTEIAKNKEELAKLGLSEKDYYGNFGSNHQVKINPLLKVGDSQNSSFSVSNENSQTSNMNTQSTIIGITEDTVQYKKLTTLSKDEKSISQKSIQDCKIVEQGEAIKYKTQECKTVEAQGESADLDLLNSILENFRSTCRVRGSDPNVKASYEISYGNYRFADGRVVKAFKTTSRSNGKVFCYKPDSAENVDSGNGETTSVNITTYDIPSVVDLLSNASFMPYSYSETKSDDGRILGTSKIEQY